MPPNPVVLSNFEGAARTEEELKDPENVSCSMLCQGVLSNMLAAAAPDHLSVLGHELKLRLVTRVLGFFGNLPCPAFKHKKVLVWYAAFSNHCSLFTTATVIEEFNDEVKGFSTSKRTIQYPADKPMPVTLIKKLT